MFRRLLEHALQALRELAPIDRVVLVGIMVLHVVGIGWGLPASDGWDVDGIAPRDFLPGVIETFTPGDYFTYPPFHLTLLSIVTLPVTLVALVNAPTTHVTDVVQTFIQVPYMTSYAMAARLVTLTMSIGLVLVLGKTGVRIFGPRARPWVLAIAGTDAAGTYYAHTSNLDVPALFWGSIALYLLVRAVQEDRPRDLRVVGVVAACAIATKDQAYAFFALSVPLTLTAWLLVRARGAGGRGRAKELALETLRLGVITVALVLLLDGAITNPTGFAARVRFLTGPASQDFAQFANDTSGRLAALWAAITFLPHHHPLPVGALFVLGVFAAVVAPRDQRTKVAAMVPLFAMLSFTLAFNCVARRVEERFMLPQMQLLSVYAGGALAFATERVGRGLARGAKLGLARAVTLLGGLTVLAGAHGSVVVIANMLGDSRYDAESFLRSIVAEGDVIEVYGGNVYLPRFPTNARVERVGHGSVTARNPLPGVLEVKGDLSAIEDRKPRFVVVSTGFAWRHLQSGQVAGHGWVLPESQRMSLADADATAHIRALFSGTTAYAVRHVSTYQPRPLLPPRPLHASLACDVFVFERR